MASRPHRFFHPGQVRTRVQRQTAPSPSVFVRNQKCRRLKASGTRSELPLGSHQDRRKNRGALRPAGSLTQRLVRQNA